MNNREEIRSYILEVLQKKSTISTLDNVDELNYVKDGYIDSLGVIQFVMELEEKYGIEFSDEELASDEIKVVGKLVDMILGKL